MRRFHRKGRKTQSKDFRAEALKGDFTTKTGRGREGIRGEALKRFHAKPQSRKEEIRAKAIKEEVHGEPFSIVKELMY